MSDIGSVPEAPAPAEPTIQMVIPAGHGFGTMPVFLTSITTILGAIMYLRFGYAVGHVGLLGAIMIIVLGHMVTVPTAMAMSEIATNRKVEGGGAYFIISRSFGIRIGGAIGIALYFSQAISVSFYIIAFAEAFVPYAAKFHELTGITFDARMVSIPVTIGLLALMLTKGADLGVRALYGVAVILAVSIGLFLAGKPLEGAVTTIRWTATIAEPDNFFIVFAICFPAFTGMTAGVGLSGDLKSPRRSIPLGTMTATLAGMFIYLAIAWKLSITASPADLAKDSLIMKRIALWGPIIPLGLGFATLSSALGSILVAPRTLQALAKDGFFIGPANTILAKGVGASNEPRTATIVTSVIALAVVFLGNVDFVARLISMFFMVTYWALCTISFLEHFAASPSYRPSFRSRWYLSLVGSVMCLLMMFQMDPVYAVLAIVAMLGFYWLSRFTRAGGEGHDLMALFREVMAQATRRLHVRLQQRLGKRRGEEWRPSIITVNGRTFTGSQSPLKLLGWICARHGFGTYLHFIPGMLNEETVREAEQLRLRLADLAVKEFPGVFVHTMVSPSMRSALAQSLQVPGIAGTENNTVLFEFDDKEGYEAVEAVVKNALFASVTGMNLLVLRHGEQEFSRRRTIHVWLTWHDTDNAMVMLLLAYILLGHRDWRRGEIKIFAAFPPEQVEEERERFIDTIRQGRVPVGPKNVVFHAVNEGEQYRELVKRTSEEADLVIMGFTADRLRDRGPELLQRHPGIQPVLFVCAAEKVELA